MHNISNILTLMSSVIILIFINLEVSAAMFMKMNNGHLDNFNSFHYFNYLTRRNLYMTINRVRRDKSYVGKLIIPYRPIIKFAPPTPNYQLK